MKVLAMQAKLGAGIGPHDLQIPSRLRFVERVTRAPEPKSHSEQITTKPLNEISQDLRPFTPSPGDCLALNLQQLSSQQRSLQQQRVQQQRVQQQSSQQRSSQQRSLRQQSSQKRTSQQRSLQQRSSQRVNPRRQESREPSLQQPRADPRDSQAQIETVNPDGANVTTGAHSIDATRAGSIDATTRVGSRSPVPIVGAEPRFETLSSSIEQTGNRSKDTVSSRREARVP